METAFSRGLRPVFFAPISLRFINIFPPSYFPTPSFPHRSPFRLKSCLVPRHPFYTQFRTLRAELRAGVEDLTRMSRENPEGKPRSCLLHFGVENGPFSEGSKLKSATKTPTRKTAFHRKLAAKSRIMSSRTHTHDFANNRKMSHF